jgi:L-arabinose isomerase
MKPAHPMSDKIDTTHHLICEFGRHKGERWTRIPLSYLKWLANEGSQHAPIALAEIKRRGIALTQDVEISGHAIDRASQELIGKWMETRVGNEGIHAWLCRLATAARERREIDGKHSHEGMKFVFVEGEIYPTLKTVMLDRSK